MKCGVNYSKKTDIMIRIKPSVKGVGPSSKVITSGKNTKFGISEENIQKLKEITKKYQLNIIGVHQHLGNLFLNDKIDNYIKGIKSSIDIIEKNLKNIEIIDFGGGF